MNKKHPNKEKVCRNCFKVCSIATNRSYCNSCNSGIAWRKELEKGLETQPWKYVECSECMEIWSLKKKKLVNGKREGFRYEEYQRSNCPSCGSKAMQFLNNGNLNMKRLKKEQKIKNKEKEELEKFKYIRKEMDNENFFPYSINDIQKLAEGYGKPVEPKYDMYKKKGFIDRKWR